MPSPKTYQPGQPVPAGKKLAFDLKKNATELTALARKLVGSPDSKEKVKELEKQIVELQKHLNAVRKQMVEYEKSIDQISREKRKLGGIEETTLKLFSYIENNCSVAIAAIKKADEFMYRGTRSATKNVYVGSPHEERRAKDSSDEGQAHYDTMLKKAGFTALRSNSVFVTGDYYQADNYGDVFMVFPKDGFSFTWSTEHDDLVVDYNDFNDYDNDMADENFMDGVEEVVNDVEDFCYYPVAYMPDDVETEKLMASNKNENLLVKFFEPLSKKSDSLANIGDVLKARAALVQLVELLEQYTKVAGVPGSIKARLKEIIQFANVQLKAFSNNRKNKELGPSPKAVKEFIHDNGFTNKDLVSAIRMGNEIYVHGEYIAVNFDKFKKPARLYFLGRGPTEDEPDYGDDDYDDDDGEGFVTGH